jgi:hypothetical protein
MLDLEFQKKHYAATVTKIEDRGSKPYYLESDDVDREWINLAHRKFNLLDRDTLSIP